MTILAIALCILYGVVRVYSNHKQRMVLQQQANLAKAVLGIGQPNARPWPSEVYQQVPFDPSVTLAGMNGAHLRLMISPLDRRYIVEPVSKPPEGAIPPEEREIRDHLLLLAFYNGKKAGQESGQLDVIQYLATKSETYQAALHRIANARTAPPELRKRIQTILEHAN